MYVMSEHVFTTYTLYIFIGTTVIVANVHQWNDEVTVLCVFQHTLSKMCYVQLVSDVMRGFYKRVYIEGEEEASHTFTGLMSGTYTVLVYGLERGEATCSPPEPDYVTVVYVNTTLHTSETLTLTPGITSMSHV